MIYYDCSIDLKAFREVSILTTHMNEKAVKAFGTIYVRAMAASTPPHPEFSPASVLSAKKHADILTAQERVAQNIAGVKRVADLRPNAEAVYYDERHGAVYEPGTRKPAKRMGAFGMFIPTSWRSPRKGYSLPRSTPAEAYATAYWAGKSMKPSRWGVHLVRKTDLAAFIKKKQQHVGKLISGWAPAARVFAAGKGIAPGFFASLGGKGFGRIYKNGNGYLCGLAINRQAYSVRQVLAIHRRVPQVMENSRKACRKQMEYIQKWYIRNAKKKLAAK